MSHCSLSLKVNLLFQNVNLTSCKNVISSYESVITVTLVGSVQYKCTVVPLCIVDASLSHYVGN